MNDYQKRLKIPLDGGDCHFKTVSGVLIAKCYDRIVIGGRGPYIEFSDGMLINDTIFIPQEEEWRIDNPNCYYIECRTKIDNVKIYHQKKTVDYADYKVGKWYISPFDLRGRFLETLINPKDTSQLKLF